MLNPSSRYMLKVELHIAIYRLLLEHPNGLTAHGVARLLGYTSVHMRNTLNQMEVAYPYEIYHRVDTFHGMSRKTYFGVKHNDNDT